MASSSPHDGGDMAAADKLLSGDESLSFPDHFSQQQLADQAGCSDRKLRTLIERGFVDRAHGAGRGAYYTSHHLVQAQMALNALSTKGFSQNRLAYEKNAARATSYGQAISRIRAAARNIRHGVAASNLDLGCGIQAVVLKKQPPQVQVVQAAVLNAVAEVLAREQVRMLEVCKALDLGTNASPFRL